MLLLAVVEVADGLKLTANPKPMVEMVEGQILVGARGSRDHLTADLMCFTHHLILDAIRP